MGLMVGHYFRVNYSTVVQGSVLFIPQGLLCGDYTPPQRSRAIPKPKDQWVVDVHMLQNGSFALAGAEHTLNNPSAIAGQQQCSP